MSRSWDDAEAEPLADLAFWLDAMKEMEPGYQSVRTVVVPPKIWEQIKDEVTYWEQRLKQMTGQRCRIMPLTPVMSRPQSDYRAVLPNRAMRRAAKRRK